MSLSSRCVSTTGRWRSSTWQADQVGPLGFDPAIASQLSRPVVMRPVMRRSGTAETSLVTLVTDLVTVETWQEALSQRERASDLRRRW
jgi:hypothetical protein